MKVLTDNQHYQDIAEAILAKTGGTTPLKPAEMAPALNGLNIELEEAYVTPTTEQQEILPPEGVYGFSKILVDAAQEGGGDIGGDWDSAEDTTFGDDYYNVPTGNYDYSAGSDENPHYIPEIPGTGFKALFSKKVKAGQKFRWFIDGQKHEVTTNADCYLFLGTGYVPNYEAYRVALFAKASFSGTYTTPNGSTTFSSDKSGYADVHYKILQFGSLTSTDFADIVVCNMGSFSNETDFEKALHAFASDFDETTGTEQFIAFVSDTQILYDGSAINNADKSPMTIYECNAGAENTWVQIGNTDGTDYPVGAYTLVWNSHDLKDMTGQFVTQSKSDDPVEEMSLGEEGVPVERDETYTIEGETVNTFVSAVQKVTGGKTPLTPTDAALALDEYYAHPAEEMKF